MRGFFGLVRRFRDDERGVFAVLFGVFAIVLIAAAGAVVDYTSEELARTRAQQALDSAALGLAPTMYQTGVTEQTLLAKAQALVVERLGNSSLTVDINDADVDTANGMLRFSGSITVPMAFMQLLGIRTLTAKISSEATRGSINLEVAVAIDITKSMEGADQIGALETATSELIDTVVKDDQTPTYSKMAIIPWSMGVNVGALADAVRGTPKGYTSISGASWTTSSKSITAITKANPGVVTSNSHGFISNDRIYISGVGGMTQVNNKIYCVVKVDNNKFQLKASDCSGSAISTSSYSTYSSNGTAKKCLVNSCKIQITSNNHGMSNDDYVYITNVGGMTQLNNKPWQVESVATNTYVIKDVVAPTTYGTYSSGGRSYCAMNNPDAAPCTYYRYLAADGSTVRVPQISDCVTERVTDRYTNTKPSTTWLGRHYPDGNSLNTCVTNEMVPMTSDRDALHETASADPSTPVLVAAGSTAGHTGLAWAWYLLSHDFTADLFPADSESIAADPNVVDAEPVMKVIVLMTDGLFNTNYCNGVVAKNADSVAGSSAQRINCDGINSTTQGTHLCDDIAADDDNIIIYTVAFALNEIQDATDRQTVRDMLADCATDDGGAFEVTDGDALIEAFRNIARNISNLRLSK